MQGKSVADIQRYVMANKHLILKAKKSQLKCADAVSAFLPFDGASVGATNKAEQDATDNFLAVKVVANTTNFYDSHGDVHIDGIWKATIKENKRIAHRREHKSGFENIIATGEQVKVYTVKTRFEKLGSKYVGDTEALIGESKIDPERNPFMYKHYANNWVDQHSVGMWYQELDLAIDNKDYKTEYANYKRYIERVVNKDEITDGYFFAVTKAALSEYSAVDRGSNPITPTLDDSFSDKSLPNFKTKGIPFSVISQL